MTTTKIAQQGIEKHSALLLHKRSSGQRLFVAMLCLLLSSACAVKHVDYTNADDPWEGYNRNMFSINEGVYSVSLRPAAKIYNHMPDFIRHRLTHFFANIDDIPNAIHGVLQADPNAAGSSVGRFLVNTTIGILGMFDPATKMGLRKYDKDFGQTLGVWGVPAGPYFVVPLIGPSSVRDFPGRIVDFLLSPINLIENRQWRLTVQAIQITDEYAGFQDQEETLREILPDFYSTMKNYYLNKRRMMVQQNGEIDTQLYEDSL